MTRDNNVRLTKLLYEYVEGDICLYCGDEATVNDHIVPVVFMAAQYIRGVLPDGIKSHIVPSCASCNSIAGASIHLSIGAKRRYIQDRIRKKYKRFLKDPKWTEKGLADMSPELVERIQAEQEVRAWLLKRLSYRNSGRHENVKIPDAKRSSKRREIGTSTAVTPAE